MSLPRRGPTIAGAPLRVSAAFAFFAVFVGWRCAQGVSEVAFVAAPPAPPVDLSDYASWLERTLHDRTVTHPSAVWIAAAAIGGALVYVVSVLGHELGHFLAARAVDVEVTGVHLHAAGGYVEMHDDDRLTAGRMALIIGAGPLFTAALALASGAALRALHWPLAGTPDLSSSAGVTAGRILSFVFVINAMALVLNLIPVRGLDGWHLARAARLGLSRRGR